MKSFFAIALLIFFPMISFSMEVNLYSRNMPQTCQYVYKVESDLRIIAPLDIVDEELIYQLQNSWKPNGWTSPQALRLKSTRDHLIGELTFQSMSLPGNFLYRIIRITFPKSNKTCVGEFGREFGEACMPGGRNETPWRLRLLNCERP
jgi:hypothetical protein